MQALVDMLQGNVDLDAVFSASTERDPEVDMSKISGIEVFPKSFSLSADHPEMIFGDRLIVIRV